MSSTAGLPLSRAFNQVSRDCNIIEVLRKKDIAIDERLYQTLVETFCLNITDAVIEVEAEKTASTWANMRRQVAETMRTTMTAELLRQRKRFQTPVEELALHVADRIVEQLEEADRNRGTSITRFYVLIIGSAEALPILCVRCAR